MVKERNLAALALTEARRPDLYDAYMAAHPPKPPKKRRKKEGSGG